MLLEFESVEELEKWANTINNVTLRYQLFTNAAKDRLLYEGMFVLLRPSVGGRLDTGLVRLDLSPDSVKKILESHFFKLFDENHRLFYLRSYILREDSYVQGRGE